MTKDNVAKAGDIVITAGWKSGKLASIYPRGIPIGVVTWVGQLDTDIYKQIEVDPFVDFSSLDSVLVLVPKREREEAGEAAMRALDAVKVAVLVFVAAVLQTAVFSDAVVLRGTPDILLVTLMAISLLRGATDRARSPASAPASSSTSRSSARSA